MYSASTGSSPFTPGPSDKRLPGVAKLLDLLLRLGAWRALVYPRMLGDSELTNHLVRVACCWKDSRSTVRWASFEGVLGVERCIYVAQQTRRETCFRVDFVPPLSKVRDQSILNLPDAIRSTVYSTSSPHRRTMYCTRQQGSHALEED